MSPLGNGQISFHVSISQEVASHVKDILHDAQINGMLNAFVSALKVIIQRLQSDPDVFGEPTYFLNSLGLQMRVGVVWPLWVI